MAMRVNGVDEARLHYDGDSVAASDSRSSSRERIFSNKASLKLNLSSLAPINLLLSSCLAIDLRAGFQSWVWYRRYLSKSKPSSTAIVTISVERVLLRTPFKNLTQLYLAKTNVKSEGVRKENSVSKVPIISDLN